MAMKTKKLLGKLLVENGMISEEQLEAALKEQKKTKEFLGTTIIKLGFASEENILTTLSKQLEIEYAKLKDLKIDPELINEVPAKFAYHYKFIPIKLENNILTIAFPKDYSLHKESLESKENRLILEKIFLELLHNARLRLHFILTQDVAPKNEPENPLLRTALKMFGGRVIKEA